MSRFVIQVTGYTIPTLSVWRQTTFSDDVPTLPKPLDLSWEQTTFSDDAVEAPGNSSGFELVEVT